MTIHLTEVSRERALAERARWVGLRLETIGEVTPTRRYRVVDPMTGAAVSQVGAGAAEFDLDGAEAIIDLHSKPTRLGD
jgi:hypothetical protein